MKEFEYDYLQEEEQVHGLRLRSGARRPVTLPSDALLPWELARRSGPCRTYRLGRPMILAEFEQLPVDLRRLFLKRLREQGGSESDVEQMLGAARGSLRAYRVPFDRQNAVRWEQFLNPGRKEA